MTLVLNRASGPRTRKAATAVSSFMLDAGTRFSEPPRSYRTWPVNASWTSPVKVPPPSGFNTGSSWAATAAGSGTGAESVSGDSPCRAESVAGTCCQVGVSGAATGAGPTKAGASSQPAGRARTTIRTRSSAVGQASSPRWNVRRNASVNAPGPDVSFMLVLVLKS